MRKPAVVIALLVLFGLVPIGAWLAMAASLEPAGLGRNIGKAVLVLLSPLPLGALLMIVGAGLLQRTRRAGRIVATVGAGLVLLGGAVVAAFWLRRFGSCGGPGGACIGELLEGSSPCWAMRCSTAR